MDNEVKNIWNENATFWDQRMGEGNDFHKELIEQNQLSLLNIDSNSLILDVACGNGQFARKMAEHGAKVIAFDFAEEFIKIAQNKENANKIDYRVIDATDEKSLSQLNEYKFDGVVCTMALMDMENISTLIAFIPKVLKKSGAFVFLILHPCFNSGEITLVHEHNDFEGRDWYWKMSFFGSST